MPRAITCTECGALYQDPPAGKRDACAACGNDGGVYAEDRWYDVTIEGP